MSGWDLLLSSQKLMERVHVLGLTRIGLQMVVDVILGGVIVWTAPDVLMPLPLVYSNVVDQHFCGKCHSCEVDGLPARGHAQVEDQ